MAILQHTAQEIAVLDTSSITRPTRPRRQDVCRASATRTRCPTLQAVIRADGGTGTFDTVTLDTAAYEALYNKRADFVITFSAWEGIEAGAAGHRAAHLRASPTTGSRTSTRWSSPATRDWVASDPAAAKAFVGATVRGFEYAAANPDDAAAILVAQNPGVFDANPELPKASAEYMAAKGLLVDANGKAGTQTLDDVDRLQLVPVRAGAADRRGRQGRSRPRPTTPRCSRTTSCRDAVRPVP